MKEKIVVFTGAGISAESGLETFRAETGLWNNHNIVDVCHPIGWHKNPSKVWAFYNDIRESVRKAEPNEAHLSIARLEEKFDVVVITQNIDNLHERAGSTNVIHLHGEVTKSRSDNAGKCILYEAGYQPTNVGDYCENGFQLRPHIVWFDESPFYLDEAARHFINANKVLIIGTSLKVHPAASLPNLAVTAKDKILIIPEDTVPPHGFELLRGLASKSVPIIVNEWLN